MAVMTLLTGCDRSETPTMPTRADNVHIDVAINTATVDYTKALLTAERGDLVLLDGRYHLVTEVDQVNRNIRMRWFTWEGPAIWHRIDRMVDPQFAIMGGFWEYGSPQWKKKICGYIDATCPR